jgi:hypothetical protein
MFRPLLIIPSKNRQMVDVVHVLPSDRFGVSLLAHICNNRGCGSLTVLLVCGALLVFLVGKCRSLIIFVPQTSPFRCLLFDCLLKVGEQTIW